jgi:Rap1a immunity proteins
MHRVILAALMAFVGSFGALAQGSSYGSQVNPELTTGRYWLPICENPNQNFRCVDMINGLNDGHAQMVSIQRVNAPYCPGNATLGAMTDVAVAYVRRNYHLSHMRFTDLALASWIEAWRCRRY